jgi:glyoxylase-like metal-dependent hydrolase (beta-lactamase superfamily II)
MPSQVQIQAFFDESTNTVSYLVADPETRQAVIIDPVLDYDHNSGNLSTASADKILDAAKAAKLDIVWLLETHVHADHLSAASYLKKCIQAPIGIGEHIKDVQAIFAPLFNLDDISGDGAEFDHRWRDGEQFSFGKQIVEVLHTPGHTPACVSYRIGDVVFVGDTLFMPDYGTARADFPGGSAHTLYGSIQRLLTLPDETRMFLCHDYLTKERKQFVWETTVGDQRRHNIHIHDGISEAEFVAMRQKRDLTLAAPKLLLPSIQVNIQAGRLPAAESNGTHYLKVPLKITSPLL